MESEYPASLGIKSWAEADRPREKMLLKGKSALSDAELLAIIIGSGSENETAVDLAKKLLHSAQNSLIELGKRDIETLKKFKGIGNARAVSIVAALELGRRRQAESALQKNIIKSPRAAYEILLPDLADLPHEEFVVLLLNRKCELIRKVKVSSGGTSGTIVDIKIVLKEAIQSLSTSLILAHNHPSGSITPSEQDKKLTKHIKDACQLLDITLYDHIIVGNQNFFSFSDEGLL